MSNAPKTVRRAVELNDALLRAALPLYRLRKIGASQQNGRQIYAYTISLMKEPKRSLEETVGALYARLEALLVDGETLTAENKRFHLSADGFEVFYYMEAWRKCADRRAYMENGAVKTELLHRMSCEQASAIFKKHGICPFDLLNTMDALQDYTDHADRYAALAKRPLLLSILKG